MKEISEERQKEIEVVINSYKSVISQEMAYASMPVSSGMVLYNVLEKYGIQTKAELIDQMPDVFKEEVKKVNIEKGIIFSRDLEQRLGKPVISPASFEKRGNGWREKEFMILWYRVLDEIATEVHMMDGWEYSTGGCQEFVYSINKPELKVYDTKESEINLGEGIIYMDQALRDLDERGFQPESLIESYNKLLEYNLKINKPKIT